MRPKRCALNVESLEIRTVPSLAALAADAPLLPHLTTHPTVTGSTASKDGDQNPYGVAFVQANEARGLLHAGSVLVSDFNDATTAKGGNVQGTGTDIVEVSPTGHTSTFFHGKPPLGLTTALGVLPGGFVIVGSLPSTTDTMGNTTAPGPGSLLLINSHGKLVQTLVDPKMFNGPWDLTVHSDGNRAQVFVSNAISSNVMRIDLIVGAHGPHITSKTQIGSGYAWNPDPAALVVGPTGLAYDTKTDTLYVASTKDNKIYAISRASVRHSDAGTGKLVVNDPKHLHGPLGLVIAPNGDLITSNGDAPTVHPPANGQQNFLLEYTRHGKFVAERQIDNGAPGAAFGLAIQEVGSKVSFAAVNDNQNDLEIWDLKQA